VEDLLSEEPNLLQREVCPAVIQQDRYGLTEFLQEANALLLAERQGLVYPSVKNAIQFDTPASCDATVLLVDFS
jgi:hypothetical protein